MDSKVKNVLLLVLVIGLVGMTSAYALLSQNLSVTSTAKVTGGSWDVHIENLTGPSISNSNTQYTGDQVGATATDGATITTTPAAKATTISGLQIAFTKPGTTVSYTFDLVNNGSIDAILDSYSIKSYSAGDNTGIVCTGTASDAGQAAADAALVCGNLTFSLEYSTGDSQAGTAVAATQTLDKKTGENATRRNVTMTVTYADDDQLPSDDVNVSGLDIAFTYIQK